MPRWRVDFMGKVLRTLRSLEAPDEKRAGARSWSQGSTASATTNEKGGPS
jgi:hypothetical protein